MDKRRINQPEIRIEGSISTLTPDQIVFEPGELGAVLEWTITHPDGTVKEYQVRKSESFVRQFIDLLMVQMMAVSEVLPSYIRDVTNTLREIAVSSLNFQVTSATGDDSYGILVGTGNTPPTISDYALQTKIAHGVGAGQLQCGGVTFGLPTSNLTTSHFTVTRNFANGSGSPITVYEIGLYVKGDSPLPWLGQRWNSSLRNNFCTIRDVILAGINILNGETLTVNYRLQCVI
jgi:hypothetical protein